MAFPPPTAPTLSWILPPQGFDETKASMRHIIASMRHSVDGSRRSISEAKEAIARADRVLAQQISVSHSVTL